MFGFERNHFVVKPHELKLFCVGMCIVLAAELFMEISWKVPQCYTIDPTEEISSSSTNYFGKENSSYARHLASTIHVYCFILTEPSQFTSQRHAQNTWIRRCTKHAFVTPGSDEVLEILDAKHNESTYVRKSWNALRITLRALYSQKEVMMYYLKADYNDYIIMENLRHMLESEDPKQPFLIGHLHEPGPHGDKISGSAGYVLSREALKRIVMDGLDRHPACAQKNVDEDVQISVCAEAVGVKVRDSFDFLGKSRFSNVSIYDLLGPHPNNTPRWYPEETDYTMPSYNLSKLPASPFLVSFTGIDGTMMYVLEYLLYHLRAVGVTHRWLWDQRTSHT